MIQSRTHQYRLAIRAYSNKEYDNIRNYARVGNKSKDGKTIEPRRRSLRTSMLSHAMLSISFHVCQDHK